MDSVIQLKGSAIRKICGDQRTLFHDFKQCLKPQGSMPSFSSSVFFSEAAFPKKISCSKISQNSIGKPTVDFCFSCRAYDFISIETELFSMLPLEFRSSYFSKYLRLIGVIRNSHRRCSIKKAVLKHFAIFTGKHLC